MSHLRIPGSVHLVALGDSGAGSSGANPAEDERTAIGGIILHPRPSHDVNDPLNWTRRRKQIATVCLFIYVLAAGMGTTALYSVLTPISDDTGIPLSTLNAGTGYMFLLLGWGALVNQPLALTFGKRPIYMISLLGNIGCCVWMPYIKSEGEWIANKVLQGFFVTPIESLVEISITDLYFAHERSTYIGLYAFALFGSNYFAPLVAGFIDEGMGWHWVMYWSAIWSAGGLIVLFFLMEETNYVCKRSEVTTSVQASGSVDPKNADLPHVVTTEVDLDLYRAGGYALAGEPTRYWRKLKLYRQRYTSIKVFATSIYRPLLLFRFPSVVWAGLIYGSALVWYNVLNATASSILSAAPYNFRSSMVGLMYVAPLIGACLSALYAGWFGDRFSLWFARRTRGIREPEDRLWLMTITVILCPTALILWGVGAAENLHFVGLAFGMGLSAFCSGVAGILSLGYAIDSYKELDGEVMITVICIRNSLSFAIGYGITPWLTLGLKDTFVSAAMVGMTVFASFLLTVKWGKSWRSMTAPAYWRYVDSSDAMEE